MTGWLKLHRELIDKPIWLNSSLEQRTILITLLCMANHTPNQWEWKGSEYTVQAGQFVTSVQSIIDKCRCKDITRQKVRSALSRFEKLGFLTVETTKQNSLVTIVNWDKYQGSDTDNNQQTNIHLTNNQPTPNQHLTTNKECNNYNNNKNDNNTAVRAAAASAVNHYIQNINPTASPMEVEKLAIWVKELDRESKGNDVVICAINDAVMCNHRSLKYIDKILDRCKKQGIYTAEAFAAQKEVFMSQKKKSTGIKVNTFTNYEQRQYDDDELERLLAEKEKRWMEGD